MADTLTPSSGAPAALAKGALRRLATARLEPTPANFARAYAEEAGQPEEFKPSQDHSAEEAAALAQGWAGLIGKLTRGLERGSKQWTAARKKDSLQRVLDGSRSDALRLQQRLRQLVAAWDEGTDQTAAMEADANAQPPPGVSPAAMPLVAVAVPVPEAAATATVKATVMANVVASHHPQIHASLSQALQTGLQYEEPRATELANELAALADRIAAEGANEILARQVAGVCARVERLFAHRHHLVDELMLLCRSLTAGLTDLAEDGSWAQGQSQALSARLDDASGARAVHAARELLEHTRGQQKQLLVERDQARDAMKAMIQSMLSELGELGSTTGRFNDSVVRYADVIERADTLEGLAGVVREMVDETRAVHEVVAGARERLVQEHSRASELEGRVRELESELRRLAEEVSTDVLTQVANRRGMAIAFEAERARVERGGQPLAIGLIDIDNFKRLNDSLGHAAGDVALKSLATRVKEWLRPVDHVARFGGEEFVVLLPETPVEEGQQALTRLQRQLSASLFMHEGREVFVTFSAGVTSYRPGETVEAALERADEALYEAKRTGKNRTCIG